MDGVVLSGADIYRTRFEDVGLADADLKEVELHHSQFIRSTFRGADFTNAMIQEIVFADCDFTGAIGLETVTHVGPSSLGIDTLFRSSGQIPADFLRGCGVPKVLIEYSQSLIESPFKFYKCFISYTETDNTISERLYNDLQARGVRCWRWRDDAKWGRSLMGEIDRAIKLYDKLIVICSKTSLKSEGVIREIERALQKEQREKRDVLFPIRIDDSVFEWEHELQADLIRKVIGDFTGWQDRSAYSSALDKLAGSLQTTG